MYFSTEAVCFLLIEIAFLGEKDLEGSILYGGIYTLSAGMVTD